MASSTSSFSWDHRAFCLVTGASRGIGKEIAVQFSTCLADGSVMLLMARDTDKLSRVKVLIESSTPGVAVKIAKVDFSTSENEHYLQAIKGCLDDLGLSPKTFQHAIIVHNAATNLTEAGYVSQWEDMDLMASYMRTNVYSALSLNTQFLKLFSQASVEKRTVIQITSRAGTEPFKRGGLYGMGKAARDLAFKTLALEEPSILVLSYSPGPVYTDMLQKGGLDNPDAETKAQFRKMFDEGMILTTEESVNKLMKMLGAGEYKSGDKLSYYSESILETIK